MKTIKFTAYLFYRYYSTGSTKDIPYVSTLCALVMLVGLHLFQALILFDSIDLFPTNSNNKRANNFLIIGLVILPIFLILTFVVKKSELNKMRYETRQIQKGNIALIIYIITSILLIPVLMYFKKGAL
ncbi:MAG: hypothetical protein ACK4S0_01855 [Sediminibacterium sp.]